MAPPVINALLSVIRLSGRQRNSRKDKKGGANVATLFFFLLLALLFISQRNFAQSTLLVFSLLSFLSFFLAVALDSIKNVYAS